MKKIAFLFLMLSLSLLAGVGLMDQELSSARQVELEAYYQVEAVKMGLLVEQMESQMDLLDEQSRIAADRRLKSVAEGIAMMSEVIFQNGGDVWKLQDEYGDLYSELDYHMLLLEAGDALIYNNHGFESLEAFNALNGESLLNQIQARLKNSSQFYMNFALKHPSEENSTVTRIYVQKMENDLILILGYSLEDLSKFDLVWRSEMSDKLNAMLELKEFSEAYEVHVVDYKFDVLYSSNPLWRLKALQVKDEVTGKLLKEILKEHKNSIFTFSLKVPDINDSINSNTNIIPYKGYLYYRSASNRQIFLSIAEDKANEKRVDFTNTLLWGTLLNVVLASVMAFCFAKDQ